MTPEERRELRRIVKNLAASAEALKRQADAMKALLALRLDDAQGPGADCEAGSRCMLEEMGSCPWCGRSKLI